jgi:hypothetical protein
MYFTSFSHISSSRFKELIETTKQPQAFYNQSTMRLQTIVFLAVVTQPAAASSINRSPIDRTLESPGSKIIGGQPTQLGEFPYFVNMDGMWGFYFKNRPYILL